MGVGMLETPRERVKLLKAGIAGKTIEKLYVIYNHFKIVDIPVIFELVEIEDNNSTTGKAAEYATACI